MLLHCWKGRPPKLWSEVLPPEDMMAAGLRLGCWACLFLFLFLLDKTGLGLGPTGLGSGPGKWGPNVLGYEPV
ncbi:hypothetical protein RchiOBHm_Chr2g0174551 [Rosa chinensis]|uniref:Uncharacterized protein n=1 Tax=Rosa chinensis TaxID=74649 RepID=A0A2P6S658_ROSCH|nr:hypothetical protein RchiOBHm_Chr2g0174551 [Rosa chinensis]